MARTKGTGGITRLEQLPKAKCRKWRLTIVRDGKRRSRRFEGTYSQAEAALRRFEAELDMPQPSTETFGDYAERWHARRARAGELAAQTLAREADTLKRLCHTFGSAPIASLTRDGIQDGLLEMRDGDTPSGRKLSGTTMNKTFALMKQILGDAVLSGVIDRNPMDMLKAPRRDTAEKQAVPFDDVRRMLALLELRPIDAQTVAVRLMVLAGLRRSEVVGLEWRDVRGGMIHVGRSVAELTGEVKVPKSAAGIRSVPMLPQLASALDAWRVAQARLLAALGIEQAPGTPVVTSSAGTRMAAQNLWKWWSRERQHLGVSCSLHELRHTFLTMLANSGASAQALKSMAGWSSISMANVYVHDDEAANRAAVGALGSRFSGGTLGEGADGTFEPQRRATQSNADAVPDGTFPQMAQRTATYSNAEQRDYW